jgi:hypothetical protein
VGGHWAYANLWTATEERGQVITKPHTVEVPISNNLMPARMMHHQYWVFPQIYWIGKVCSSANQKKKKGQCHSVFYHPLQVKVHPQWGTALVSVHPTWTSTKERKRKEKTTTTTTVAKRVVRGQALDLVQEQSFITGARDRVVVPVTSGFWAPSPLCSANAHATEDGSSSSSSYGFTPPCCIAPPVGPV